MTARHSISSPLAITIVLAVLTTCAQVSASGPQKPHNSGQAKINIDIQSSVGTRIAHTSRAEADSATLVFDHEYQPGDRILIAGPRRMAVQLDEGQPECQLYLPDSAQDRFLFEIPFGRKEPDTGSAYAPTAFAGTTHRVTVRALRARDMRGYRNLALNPCDRQWPAQAPSEALASAADQVPAPLEAPPQRLAYPHASSNSVHRNWPDFRERNAIDGIAQNGHHGIWPYQSWGPERRADLWWKVDFGRTVAIDKVRLMIRADFPHDSYWNSATLEFSDGSRLPIRIQQSAEFQQFSFPRRGVSWIRLTGLTPVDPAHYCSLLEFEAWGRELP